MHPPIDPFNDIDFDKHTLAGEACEVEKGPPSSLYDQQLEAEAIREGIRPVFLAKVRVLNKAIADLGMGRYQVSPRFFQYHRGHLTHVIHTVGIVCLRRIWMVRRQVSFKPSASS